jgi:hypothetical protein
MSPIDLLNDTGRGLVSDVILVGQVVLFYFIPKGFPNLQCEKEYIKARVYVAQLRIIKK